MGILTNRLPTVYGRPQQHKVEVTKKVRGGRNMMSKAMEAYQQILMRKGRRIWQADSAYSQQMIS